MEDKRQIKILPKSMPKVVEEDEEDFNDLSDANSMDSVSSQEVYSE
jgi:hypothetical protein